MQSISIAVTDGGTQLRSNGNVKFSIYGEPVSASVPLPAVAGGGLMLMGLVGGNRL